jgi:hypothetical protein
MAFTTIKASEYAKHSRAETAAMNINSGTGLIYFNGTATKMLGLDKEGSGLVFAKNDDGDYFISPDDPNSPDFFLVSRDKDPAKRGSRLIKKKLGLEILKDFEKDENTTFQIAKEPEKEGRIRWYAILGPKFNASNI